MGLFRSLTIGLLILALPVALITTNIRVAVSEQSVYDYSVRHYGAEDASGIPESELIRANGILVRYLTDSGPRPLSIAVRDDEGDIVPLFNPRETAHMADVHSLVQAMLSVQVLAVAVLLTAAVAMLVLWPARVLAAAALSGSLLTVSTLLLASMIALSGFDSAWSQFHVFAFSNDLWQLDPDTDHLIQMFPETFWQDITTLIGMVTFAEALLIAGVSGVYLFLTRERDTARYINPEPILPGPAGHSHTAPPRLSPPDPRHYV